MSRPDGAVALVTGGSRGIGRAIAERLEDDGFTVATLGRTSGDVQADVGDADAVAQAFDEVRERFGPVAVLVNNAGERRDGLAIRMKPGDWECVIDTNLNGAFHCIRRALDDMLGARWGRIVNISSVVGITGNVGQANYAAAKAGLLGLTKSIAREFGSKGITANAIAPGFIETDIVAHLSDEIRAAALAQIPAGKYGQPEDVAEAVAFLVSERAAYINGQTLNVDGGMVMA